MKKSIEKAIKEAIAHSKEHGTITWVLDKHRKKAVISASEWVVKERQREGWMIVAVFNNGIQIK